jgi:hypothetical protein
MYKDPNNFLHQFNIFNDSILSLKALPYNSFVYANVLKLLSQIVKIQTIPILSLIKYLTKHDFIKRKMKELRVDIKGEMM